MGQSDEPIRAFVADLFLAGLVSTGHVHCTHVSCSCQSGHKSSDGFVRLLLHFPQVHEMNRFVDNNHSELFHLIEEKFCSVQSCIHSSVENSLPELFITSSLELHKLYIRRNRCLFYIIVPLQFLEAPLTLGHI